MADITFLQILDTSIKIGLGALISGAATYWVTKLNHERDIEKNTIRRKQELVEQVVAEFEDYWNNRIELYAQATVLISNSPITSTTDWQKQYKLHINKSAETTKKNIPR